MTINDLLQLIDSAQSEATQIFINNNGYNILDFTLDEYYTNHIKESYDNTLNQNIR
jgi:hypothetical protein